MLLNLSNRRLLLLILLVSLLFSTLSIVPLLDHASPDYAACLRLFLQLFVICQFIWAFNLLLCHITLQRVLLRAIAGLLFAAAVAYVAAKFFFPFTVLHDDPVFMQKAATTDPANGNIRPQGGLSFLPPLRIARPNPYLMPVLQSFIINLCVLLLLELLHLQVGKRRAELENKSLRIAQLEARHSQLTVQVQPHFLFNSLHLLKSMIRTQPQEAETYLVKLADLLRSAVDANRTNTVLVEDELKLAVQYFEMQQIRFPGCLVIDQEIPEAVALTARVPVYSLQLLAENAIKHNRFSPAEQLRIAFRYQEANQALVVENTLRAKTNRLLQKSGTGLSNLSERYRLLGGGKISILRSDHSFSVQIPLLPYAHTDN